ncbi:MULTISPECIES: hypothetical protein [Streptomyces]|uniref:hypothetical protein n=1 Tax=Streptomyces TaxID=1883 RepID=UPI0007CD405A|nr:hypothetical protein A4V12_30185 [Streptomyces noursei]
MKFTTSTDADMEIFLSVVGKHLGAISAKGLIDLYTDEPIEDPAPQEVYQKMREEVLAEHAGSKGDHLMGVPLDFTSEAGLQRFALLGNRTIGCEAYVGKKLVFTSIENERIVWLDVSGPDASSLEEAALAEGARSVRRLP